MKKLISTALALVVGVGCMTTLAACGTSEQDEATANKIITALDLKYGSNSSATTVHSDSYKVVGKQTADGATYDISWSVSSDYSGYQTYVSVGEMDEDNMVEISITQATEEIEYKLTAGVKVGKVEKSIDFDRKISAKAPEGNGTKESPYSVSQVFSIANSLDEPENKKGGITYYGGATDPTRVCVTGYIINCGTDSSANKRVGFVKIADYYEEGKSQNDDDVLTILSVNYGDILTGYSDLKLGAKITVSGYIALYRSAVDATPYGEITYFGSNGIQCEYLEKEELTDAGKIDAAKAAVDSLIKKTYTKEEVVDLPTSSNGATLNWAVKGETNLVTVENNKLTIVSIPATATEVTLTVTISCGSATPATKDVVITLTSLNVAHAGTESDPFSVSDANAIASTLGEKDYYLENDAPKQIYVTGYIKTLGTWNATNKRYNNMYITDVDNSDVEILVYSVTAADGTPFEKQGDLEVGDLVVLVGYIQVYNSKAEITYSGNDNVNCVSKGPDTRTPAEKIAAALAKVEDTITITKAGDTTLPVSSVSGVTFEWSVVSGEAATVTNNGTVLHVDALPDEDATVSLKVTATCDGTSDDKNVTATIKAAVVLDGETELMLDLEGNFATYASDWTASYGAHSVTFAQAGVSAVDGTIDFTNADKQTAGNTIDTMPVLASKNNEAQYVTVTVEGVGITAVEFELAGWAKTDGSYKTFTDIHIEYSLGGSWISCSEVITTPAALASTTIPAGVSAVRLSAAAGGSSNVQLGIAGIKLTVGGSVEGGNQGNNGGDNNGDNNGGGSEVVPGESKTASVTITDYATTNGWVNGNEGGSNYDTVNVDNNITVTATGTPVGNYALNTGKYYSDWRIYQNESPSLTFTAAAGYTIISIKVTYTVTNTGILSSADKSTNYNSGEDITVNASTVTFTVGQTADKNNGQVRITAIEVVYVAA